MDSIRNYHVVYIRSGNNFQVTTNNRYSSNYLIQNLQFNFRYYTFLDIYFTLSGSIFGGTVYYALQFKKKMKRSATFRREMQPSVMVVTTGSNNAQITQIKTHPSARQKDYELKKELELMYDVLPPDVTNPTPRFVFLCS